MTTPKPTLAEQIDLEQVDSVVLRRLIEEVRSEAAEQQPSGYNRTYNRYMSRPGEKYNRTYSRHNR
jgi:hypothetical protein